MGEFLANVRAVLDVNGIAAQIRQIENMPVTLSNVTINQNSIGSIRSQIQNALNTGNFSINLNSRNMNRQYMQMGANAGDSYMEAFRRSVRTRSAVPDDVIANMQDNLIDRYGFSEQDMARVTRHLADMNLRITRIRTAFDDNNNLRMSVRGMDRYGEMVDLVTTYNRETNELLTTRTTVTQTFDHGANSIRQFNTNIEAARNALGSNGITATIGRLNERFTNLGSTGHAMLAGVGRDLDELRRIHASMVSAQSDDELVDYYNRFNSVAERARNNLSIISSETNPLQAFDRTLARARDSIANNGIDATLGRLNERFVKLGSTGHAMLSGVGQDLDELRRIHSNMVSTQSDDELFNYYNQFNEVAERVRNNLNIISSETSPLQEFENTLSRARNSIADNSIDATTAKLAKQLRGLNTTDTAAFDSIRNDIGTLERLGREMKSMDGDALVANFEQYEQVARRVKNSMDAISNANQKMLTDTDILARKNKMTDWLDKNSRAAKKYGQTIKDLCDRYDQLDITSDNAMAQAKSIDDAWNGVVQKAKAEGLTGKSIFDQVKDFGKKALGFISVGEVIDTAVRGFKEMYQAVYDIDTAMTNLKKVTNESEETYDSFLNRSADSAQRLGRTVSSLVEQTANWSKLGYSLPEAEKLSELSSIYANVAEVDDNTAVSDIVTTLKAFDLSTSDAIRVVDSLNELGNSYAVSAADLGDGLSKSASAMNAAGTDMYKTLAMLTGGAEITQNAGEFGSFLKVASMRLRGMKGALEELGEEVDPTVDSISKVQTQILNLTGGKVNIFDDAGEFRDYYDIMAEIAEIYDSLASTDQANLSEILFGKMRGNQGQALIQAFQSGQIQAAYEDAIGSAGSAAAEQAAWMESLEAKTQQFQSAWQSLSQTVLNTDFLKGTIDAGRGLLNVLEGIVKVLTLPGTLAAGGGIFAFFKNLDWAITSHTIFPKFDSESNLMSSQSIMALQARHKCWEVL